MVFASRHANATMLYHHCGKPSFFRISAGRSMKIFSFAGSTCGIGDARCHEPKPSPVLFRPQISKDFDSHGAAISHPRAPVAGSIPICWVEMDNGRLPQSVLYRLSTYPRGSAAPKKRQLSPEARGRIASARKARWAKANKATK